MLLIDSWYYIRDKQKVGPIQLEKLKQLFLAGQLHRTDMVLQQGSTKWVEAHNVSGLTCAANTAAATTPATPQPTLRVAIQAKLANAPAPISLAQVAQGLPKTKNVKKARFFEDLQAILDEKVRLGLAFCQPSGKNSQTRYWSRDEKRILREKTIAIAGKPNSLVGLKKELAKVVKGADRAFLETVVRELISEGRLFEYPSKNKSSGPMFGATPPPPLIPWLEQATSKDAFNSVVADCQKLLTKTGVTVDTLIDTLRRSLCSPDTKPERTRDSSLLTLPIPEKKEPAKTPPSYAASPPVATCAPATTGPPPSPSPPPFSPTFPAKTDAIPSGMSEDGLDPETGQVIDAARYEQWKKDQRHKARATNEPGVPLRVAFEQGRRAVENWVDGEVNGELVAKGDMEAIFNNTSLQECLNPYRSYGKEMLEKLVRHLQIIVENRNNFYRKSARKDQPSKDDEMDGFPNLEL